MFIVDVSTSYVSGDSESKKRQEIWRQVGEWFKSSGAQLMDGEFETTFNCDREYYYLSAKMIVSTDHLLHLMMWQGVDCKISQDLRGLIAHEAFAKAAEKQMPQGVPARDEFNQKVEVHMPGQALASYNETLLMEDSCTDALQAALDKGWRIIAACPQPDSRRPDYILGRWNPDRDGSNRYALRQPDTAPQSIRASDYVSISSTVAVMSNADDVRRVFGVPDEGASPDVSDPGPAPTYASAHESGTDAPAVAPRPYLTDDSTDNRIPF
ncbi:hypothetical protein [Burkholderia phage BCSR129]|nr:hypothetical protein [Burkholderia phage BCSR129]